MLYTTDMNRWLAATLLLSFLFLALFSVIFGKKIRSFDPPLSITPTPSQSAAPSPEITQEQSQLSVVATDLQVPWGLAFLPDGSMLFTERPGRVRFIDVNHNLISEPIMTFSDVNATGEGGLLGVAVDPQFVSNKFVYFYYSYGYGASDMHNRVVRFVFDGKHLTDQKIIVDGIPGNSNHDGGRIKFGPDGNLYITTGDSEAPSLAQNTTSLAGKILRVVGEKAEVYSYGHRNPQGLAWDDRGKLWATEHGRSAPTGYDELNRIEQGKNYGWPTIQGDEKKEGMVTPVINSGPTTTWAPSGAAFYRGSIFFGGLKGQALFEAVLSGDGVSSLKKHFEGQLGRIRDVVLGPDNMLYITTSNRDGRGTPQEKDDKIYRVNPQKL